MRLKTASGFVVGQWLFAVGMGALFSASGSISPAQADTITLLATDDASVRLSGSSSSTSANSETNFGSRQILDVNSSTSASANAKAYMRFDVSGINLNSISGASLNLNTNSAGYSADNVFSVYGLRDGYAGADATGNGTTTDDADIHGENWPESVIDWNSAPANLLTSANSSTLNPADRNKFTADAILLGQFTIAANADLNTQVSFSQSGLQNFLRTDTDGQVTLMLANESGSIFSFISREAVDTNGMGGYGPQLSLTVQPVPEPNTYALIVVGLAMLSVFARRKQFGDGHIA